jgi:lipoate-protein ligase A
VDFERLTARGWDVVRRPTGGRAILHTDELTYSVVLPADDLLVVGGIVESYRRLSLGLTAALNRLGAQTAAEQRDERAKVMGPVCFEVPSHYEITVEGRKLVGSAQLRRKGGVLQHGSLPLRGDLARICDALAYEDETARGEGKHGVRKRATTLSEALGGVAISWQTAADAVAAGFAEAYGLQLERGTLTPAESAEAERLTKAYETVEKVR